MRRFAASATLVFVCLTLLIPAARSDSTYQLNGGRWFNGTTFVRKKLYVVNGVFQQTRPARVDRVIELGELYIVAPFGDAHSHAFDNPKSIESAVQVNLRDGIFYALSLTNSINGKHLVADKVNKPESIDVAYAINVDSKIYVAYVGQYERTGH
jgi:hypothetical protein